MNPIRFTTALSDLIQQALIDVHTTVPAKVTSVDYGSGRANVLPLVKTQIGVDKIVSYPELSGVPIAINGGNLGKARISFPIQAGDTVVVLFSERDPTNVLAGAGVDQVNPVQTSFLGLFPLAIISYIPTAGNSRAISNTDVVLENEQAIITLKPDGTVSMENSSGSVLLNSSGQINLSNNSGSIQLLPNGSVNINGLTISPQGKLTDSGGLSFDNHGHSGIERGNGVSDGPVPR